MGSFRPELHVAQQSRRDKLRVPQVHHLQDFPHDHLEHPHPHPRLNQDLLQVRNVNNANNLLYDPAAAYSSEIINFSTKSNILAAQRDRDIMVRQEIDATQIVADQDAPFANWSLPLPVSSNINALSKSPIEPQNCGNWKGSQQSFDWVVSYASGESNIISSPMFFGEVSNMSAYPQCLKPAGYNGFQDHVRSSLKNSLQELEMVSHVEQNIRGTGRGAWADGGNKLATLPAYENESDVLCFDNAGAWSGELGCAASKSSPGEDQLRNVVGDSNQQGLSLSLSSSNPTLKLPVAQFGEGCGSQDLHSSRTAALSHKTTKSGGHLSIVGKCCGRSLQDIVGISTNTYRNTGPLGPFTGYATILKASRFLKPAQQLLDEFCGISGSKLVKTCEVSERTSGEVSTSGGDALNAAETEVVAIGNSSAASSSSTFYTCNEMSCDGGVGSSSSESFRPEFQQKKAKLLYIQEEVCRRYKQYHGQMQMVVSSFESVAGLSCATPYISLALKSVSRHFRCLKNAISEQLKHIGKALGEDLSSPTSGTSTSKGDANMLRLKHLDQSLQRQRYGGGGNVGFLDTQQHVWRPQRGLPERSVAILRAWLFEHFLHPYPTDTDKHMLATQTGLSRNQVSNWFINARVRVWKPMVEEIHMLETKGVAEPIKNDGSSAAEGSSQLSQSLSINKRLECSSEEWNQEKRSRMDCEIGRNMDGSLMGFLPYQPSGAVSLTLGLRHGAENVQHQQQQLQQQQEDQLRQQFGGRMIHDFVG
ncbi:BEL1-like homeodomain protein 8 isoform X3 [Alnus glutinosa]|nr:BEL1-like homeodomain protein 8 isoform X3 [Alnus glutinosa]